MVLLEHSQPRQHPPVFLVEAADGTTRAAPPWFVAWVRLGAFAALDRLMIRSQERAVLALSAPVRSMAAAAFAFGYCRQRFLNNPALRYAREPARTLADLQPGTRVWLRLADRVLAGTYHATLPGGRVHTSAGTYQASVVREARALPSWVELPDGVFRLNEVGTLERAFLAGMLRSHDPLEYITSWDRGLVIVGSSPRLHADLEELIRPPLPDVPSGSLASVVRPLDAQAGSEIARIAGWRSVLMASRTEEAVWASWPEPPVVAVLDGAYAVSRWLDACEARLIIAFLDRSEPGLDAAASVLDQERAYMKPIPMDGIGWEPPSGCELFAFGSRG